VTSQAETHCSAKLCKLAGLRALVRIGLHAAGLQKLENIAAELGRPGQTRRTGRDPEEAEPHVVAARFTRWWDAPLQGYVGDHAR